VGGEETNLINQVADKYLYQFETLTKQIKSISCIFRKRKYYYQTCIIFNSNEKRGIFFHDETKISQEILAVVNCLYPIHCQGCQGAVATALLLECGRRKILGAVKILGPRVAVQGP